ncbi:MAG: hypothetical protein AAF488_07695 [Planctomycetota bacterium]
MTSIIRTPFTIERVAGISLILFTLASFTVLSPARALAHDPPDFSLEYELDTVHLEVRAMIKEMQYRHWFSHDPTTIPEMTDEEYEAALAEVREFFAAHGPILLDRVEVTPIVRVIDFQEQFEVNDFLNFIAVTLDYGVKGTPRTVSFAWNRHDTGDPSWPLPPVGVSFEYDTTQTFYQLWHGEPGATWHTPKLPKRDAYKLVQPPSPPKWKIPVTSIGLAFGSLVAATVLVVTKRGLAWGSGMVAVGAVAAVLAAPYGSVEVDPWWVQPMALPSEQEAAEIFESLHRNVYRAFDYETEDEIYDALARSIDAALLDEVYNEVYNNLIVVEEGGAVSRVRGVEIREAKISFPESQGEFPEFSVEARWRVTGTVSHWGHQHWRVNEYHAGYDLRATVDQWRIVSADPLGQERIDSGDGMIDDPKEGSTVPAPEERQPL